MVGDPRFLAVWHVGPVQTDQIEPPVAAAQERFELLTKAAESGRRRPSKRSVEAVVHVLGVEKWTPPSLGSLHLDIHRYTDIHDIYIYIDI